MKPSYHRRSSHLFTRLTLTTALGGGLLLPAVAQAQTAPVPPPVFQSVDGNFIDRSNAMLERPIAGVSIGPDGPAGLRWGWHTDPTVERSQLAGTIYAPNVAASITVSFDGRSEGFTYSASTGYTQREGAPSTLTYNGKFTYTLRDGTAAVFEQIAGGVAGTYYLTSVTYPTGDRRDYHYFTFNNSLQVRSVTTSSGYQMRFEYAAGATSPVVSKVTAFNMANENCAPDAASCSLAGNWPQATTTDIYADLSHGQYVDMSGAVTSIGYYPAASVTATAGGSTSTYAGGLVVTKPSGDKNTYAGQYKFINGTAVQKYKVKAYSDGVDGWVYREEVYPPINNVYYETYPDGSRLFYNYDPMQAAPFVTNARGDGQMAQVVSGGASYTQAWIYDAKGRIVSASQRVGSGSSSVTATAYDARGNVTTSALKSVTPGTPADIVTTASYPSDCANPKTCNQPTYTLDPLQRQTDYTYDPTHGGVLTVTVPAAAAGGIRPRTTYSYQQVAAQYYNGTGSLVTGPSVWRVASASTCRTQASCAGTADETVVSYGYSSGSNILPTTATTRDGTGTLVSTVTYSYYPTGDLKTEAGPIPGMSTRYYYDAGRRLTGVIATDPDGSGARLHPAKRITYDADGNVIKEEVGTATNQGDAGMSSFVASAATVRSFLPNGRVVTEARQVGGVTQSLIQYTHNWLSNGRQLCVAQRMNPAAYGSLPASACTLGAAGSDGPDRITRTVYDAIGRVVSVTTALGTADESTETFGYTSLTVSTVTDAKGNKTTFTKDGMLRPLKMQYPSPTTGSGTSSTNDYEQLTYDAASNITAVRQRDGSTIGMTYDNLDRVTSRKENGTITRLYSYDLQGHTVNASWNGGGSAEAYVYDALGRLTQHNQPFGSLAYQYDAAGRRTRMAWSDGLYIAYDYDLAGNVTAIRENGATSGLGVLASYAYDDLGRRTSITYGNGTSRSYVYDPSNLALAGFKLDLAGTASDLVVGAVGGTGTTISYNPAGQIKRLDRSNDAYAWTGHVNVNRSYTADGLNRYTNAGGVSFSYDGRGNLTQSGSTSYSYSLTNQLTGWTGGLYMEYGARDQLQGFGATRFAYDGAQISSEWNWTPSAPATLLRRYVPGPGVDETVVWYEGSGVSDRRFLATDERGSIVAVTDSAGNTLAINRYDEYGIPQAGNVGRFQYTGQAYLPELGMYYYKARMYSPTLGRFMQTDPIGYGDGLNWYNYVGGDPVNFTDPSGLECAGIGNAKCLEIVVTDNKNNCPGGAICFTGGDFEKFNASVDNISTRYGVTFQLQILVAGDRTKKSSQNGPCSSSPSDGILGSARAVLETTATGADVATVGFTAAGITAPIAVATKLVGYGAEAGLLGVNLYDGFANGSWGGLQVQAAGAATRLIPGGRTLQSGLRAARGPTGILRNSLGQFRSSHINNPAVAEAGDLAIQNGAQAAAGAVACR